MQDTLKKKQRRNKMATIKERDKEQSKGHLAMKTPPIVSQQEWEAARQQLLVKEKALTRSRDALAAERRRMPWMAVEKKYEFDGPKGKVSLLDLFEGRRQLIVYRAFFEPEVFGWPEHACRGCSFVADQVAHVAHLNARDTTLAFASRAAQTPCESATQRQKRGKEGRPLRRLRAAGSFHTGAARVLPQGARSIARRRSWRTEISPPHMTGDSEVERDLRKNQNSAPGANGENDDRLHER